MNKSNIQITSFFLSQKKANENISNVNKNLETDNIWHEKISKQKLNRYVIDHENVLSQSTN